MACALCVWGDARTIAEGACHAPLPPEPDQFALGSNPRAASIFLMRAARSAGLIESQWALIDFLSARLFADGGFLTFGFNPRAASIFLMRAFRSAGVIASQCALIAFWSRSLRSAFAGAGGARKPRTAAAARSAAPC